MKKITISVGLNDKVSKVQEIATDAAKGIIINNIFAVGLEGATITMGTGIYTHENGQTVTEKTIICTFYGAEFEKIKALCEILKKDLNQESIAVEITEINSIFI